MLAGMYSVFQNRPNETICARDFLNKVDRRDDDVKARLAVVLRAVKGIAQAFCDWNMCCWECETMQAFFRER
jgi:hypothetical protein